MHNPRKLVCHKNNVKAGNAQVLKNPCHYADKMNGCRVRVSQTIRGVQRRILVIKRGGNRTELVITGPASNVLTIISGKTFGFHNPVEMVVQETFDQKSLIEIYATARIEKQ